MFKKLVLLIALGLGAAYATGHNPAHFASWLNGMADQGSSTVFSKEDNGWGDNAA